MWRIIAIDTVFILILAGAISLILYLLLNNSPRFSRMLVKLRLRKEPVPENLPDEPNK